MTRDVVCGMQVDETAGAAQAEFAGRTFHFCSEGCKARFLEDPGLFLAREENER